MKEKAYNKLIILISILIPLVVVLLFTVKLEGVVKPLSFLPPIYASINGVTAALLLIALRAIKKGQVSFHEKLMKISMILSILFLLMYVAYHMTSNHTHYGGGNLMSYAYYFILTTHIILSIGVIPLVLISYVKALSKRFDKHKKIAKITFPIWLYVAVTGVLVYLMISPYYNF